METRQYALGDVITMRLMRREKGSLVAMPSSQWVKVEEPVRFEGGKQQEPQLRFLESFWPNESKTCTLSKPQGK